MNSKKSISRQEKRLAWSNHINQWKASGQSQSHYCGDNQLKFHQFIYWKQIFSSAQKVKPKPSAEAGFVSVELTPVQKSSSAMVIHLPNGIRVENAQSNDLELLQLITRWQR